MKTRYANAYVLNVVSDDHPGIIAAVSDAVAAFEGNIDAVSQTVLDGYFTLITVVSFPAVLEPKTLESRVRGVSGDLQVAARPYAPAPSRQAGEAEVFVITASGTDRPGIIRRLSHYLSGKDINIIDLYWSVSGETFVMISQVEIPRRWELGLLKAELDEIGAEGGFGVRIQHENVFVATNQLRLTRATSASGSALSSRSKGSVEPSKGP